MGKYQAYPEYKESGIEWITEIPSHWHISNIGHESSVKARLGWKGLKADEYVDEGYVFLATPNIKGKEIDFTDVNRITKDRYDESPEIMLQTGDVLVTKDGSTTGTTNLVRVLPEPATVNSSIAVLRSKGAVGCNYLFYFFVSDYTQNVITRMRGGMGVPHLFQADLRKFSMLVPPLPEQTQIANFLDHETAKIDTLIEKQQLLIKLLKEKRQAVISHAVTKGLNPQAPMKDSGVEWLGEVPEHWDVSRLKFECDVVDCRNKTPEYFENGEYFVVRTTNVKKQKLNFNGALYTDKKNFDIWTQRGIPPSGSILFTREAPTGEVCLVPDNLKFCMGQRMMNFISNSQAYTNYLFDYLISDCLDRYINSVSHGSTVSHLRVEQVENIPVPVPPQKELIAIHEHILNLKTQYDDLESNALKAIDLMKERRTALISAAVTGKIDVRNWQAPGVQHVASVHEEPLEAMA
ncbi:restriction endonuclease subunit S [Photobacterium sp. SP02]|uniref:restriction endonuclease subunit S n=1 Tax=Photobacterium sp. SP02 TaxID=3032280 RepID=UPI003144E4E7